MALHIPEIVLTIGQFLDNDSLKTCTRVCSLWRRLLLTDAWKSLHILWGTYPKPGKVVNTRTVIQSHGRLVEELGYSGIDGSTLDVLIHSCHQLRSLSFENRAHLQRNSSATRLILNNRATLTQLRICTLERASWLKTIASILKDLPNLKVFGMTTVTTPSVSCGIHDLLNLGVVRPNLTELSMAFSGGTTSDWYRSTLATKVMPSPARLMPVVATAFPALKSLRVAFKFTCNTLETLVRHCPELRALHLSSPHRDELSPGLAQALIHGRYCPKLSTLSLDADYGAEDTTMGSFIRSFPPLHELVIKNDGFSFQSLRAVQQCHAERLTLFRLSSVNNKFAASTLGGVLAMCPNLETIEACDLVDDRLKRDVVELGALTPKPWACDRSLKHFRIPIGVFKDQHGQEDAANPNVAAYAQCLDESTVNMEKTLYEQLGVCTRLETIDCLYGMDQTLDMSDKCIGPAWLLNRGLALLSKLENLRVLHIGPIKNAMGEAELEWMKAHWKTFKILYCSDFTWDVHSWLQEHWPHLTCRYIMMP